MLIITFGGCTALILIKTIKIRDSDQAWFFLGLFGFFLGWCLVLILYFFSDKAAYIVGIAGLLSILFVIEKYAVKSKYIFSIITLIGLVLVIILPLPATEISGARLASYIFLPAGGVSILVLYLYLITKVSGDLRRETIFVFLGFFLIFGGYALDIQLFESVRAMLPFWDIMNSLLMLCGGLLLAITYYRREI